LGKRRGLNPESPPWRWSVVLTFRHQGTILQKGAKVPQWGIVTFGESGTGATAKHTIRVNATVQKGPIQHEETVAHHICSPHPGVTCQRGVNTSGVYHLKIPGGARGFPHRWVPGTNIGSIFNRGRVIRGRRATPYRVDASLRPTH